MAGRGQLVGGNGKGEGRASIRQQTGGHKPALLMGLTPGLGLRGREGGGQGWGMMLPSPPPPSSPAPSLPLGLLMVLWWLIGEGPPGVNIKAVVWAGGLVPSRDMYHNI